MSEATIETPVAAVPEAWMGDLPTERPAKVETKTVATPPKTDGGISTSAEVTEPAQSSSEPEKAEKPRDESGQFVKLDSKARRDYEKRIDRLTARNKELEQRVAPHVNGTKPEPTTETPSQPSYAVAAPKQEDYLDAAKYPDPYEAYVVAKAKWEIKRDAWEEGQQQASKQSSEQEIRSAYNARAAQFAETHDDFDAVVKESQVADVNPGQIIGRIVMLDDNGPEVLYYLSQHADEALDLIATYRSLSPTEENLQLARRKLALRLASVSRGSEVEAPIRNSNAPPPAGRLGAGTRTTTERAIDLAAKGSEDYDASGYRARRKDERKGH